MLTINSIVDSTKKKQFTKRLNTVLSTIAMERSSVHSLFDHPLPLLLIIYLNSNGCVIFRRMSSNKRTFQLTHKIELRYK